MPGDELVPDESKHRDHQQQQADLLTDATKDISKQQGETVAVVAELASAKEDVKKVKRAVDHYRWSDYLLYRALRNYKPFTTRPDEPYPIGDGIENCGPGRYRDSTTGICQTDKTQTSVNLP